MGKRLKYGIILFVIAFLFRALLIIFFRPEYIPWDGLTYHNIAVNIASGKGCSESEKEPYELTFFREPGYTYFLAAIYKVYMVSGKNISYINATKYNEDLNSFPGLNGEIQFVKWIQAFIDALTICILFLLLMDYLNFKIAFLIAIVCALFFPSAYYVTYLYRETLLTFVCLLLTYFFSVYLQNRKIIYLILSALLWGISCLIFQAMILMPIFIFIYSIFNSSILVSMRNTVIYSIIGIIVFSPWIYKAYKYYPDIRVIKTLGSSLTHEMNAHTSSVKRLVYYGYITKGDMEHSVKSEYNYRDKFFSTSREQFEKSFNGYYSNLADSLNQLVKESFVQKLKRNIITGLPLIKNTIFFTHDYSPDINKRDLLKNKSYFQFVFFVVFPIIFGLFALFGIFIFFRKSWFFLLTFVYHYTLFYFLASEPRRLLPGRNFFIMFGVLTIIYFYYLFIKKVNHRDIMQFIFK